MCIFCDGRKREPICGVVKGGVRIIGWEKSSSTICSECLKNEDKVSTFHIKTILNMYYHIDVDITKIAKIYFEIKNEGKQPYATDIYRRLMSKKEKK